MEDARALGQRPPGGTYGVHANPGRVGTESGLRALLAGDRLGELLGDTGEE